MNASPTPERRNILQAVARGWCHGSNRYKTMDSTLVEAITDEVLAALTPQPMESAPRDGARVLLLWGESWVVGQWHCPWDDERLKAKKSMWVTWPGYYRLGPTAWLPLPPAPQPQKDAR